MASILLALPEHIVVGIRMTSEQRSASAWSINWERPKGVLTQDDMRALRSKNDMSGLRHDLIAIPEAEATGWKVAFQNDNWHNSASFERQGITVWSTGRDWRRAGVSGGYVTFPEIFPPTADGLTAALASATPLRSRVGIEEFRGMFIRAFHFDRYSKFDVYSNRDLSEEPVGRFNSDQEARDFITNENGLVPFSATF